jgi:hypothetical protein
MNGERNEVRQGVKIIFARLAVCNCCTVHKPRVAKYRRQLEMQA